MYQRNESGSGHGGGVAALSLDAVLPRALDPSFGMRPTSEILQGWRARLADVDLVVDLGSRIGSREWWRGLATCVLLCGAAYALAPQYRPLPGVAGVPLSPGQWEEARALGISPLAYGADTGRRMAATDAVQPLVDTPERPRIELTATIGQGDGFARALERAGVAKGQAREVADLVSEAVALRDLRSGTRVEMVLGRRASKAEARPLDSLLFRARFDLKLAVERVDGALALRRIPIAVDDTPLRIQGRVGSSLYASARAAGAPAKAVETYIRALAARMSISRDVRSGDRFDIIVEHRRAATGETEVGQLLYAGLDQGKRKTRLLKWTTGGSAQWYEASGVGEKRGVMRMPVVGRLTSGFGMRRHPLLGFSRFHKGLDFGAPYGAPIVAATDGTVSFAGWHGGHGKYVKLNHSGGLQTGYAHMSRIVAKSGQRVRQGQVIGYVGSTGLSTGPHLHYEIYKRGAPINPRSISVTTTSQLAGAELARFRAKLAGLLAVRPGSSAAKPETRSAEATSALPTRG